MRIDRIIAELLLIIARNQEKMMAQIDDLTAALATATADTQTLINNVAAEVKNLQDQIAALQGSGVDLTGVIASVNNLDSIVKAADPGAPKGP